MQFWLVTKRQIKTTLFLGKHSNKLMTFREKYKKMKYFEKFYTYFKSLSCAIH